MTLFENNLYFFEKGPITKELSDLDHLSLM
jgi:hypothetical protein